MAATDPVREESVARRVAVWDAPVRLFHWTIVALIATSWIAADQGYMQVHLWSGSAMLALLLFRIAWGFFGSTTARFRDFVRSPLAVYRYLRPRPGAEAIRYAGHNPAGGWMVVAMIAVLGAQVATGLFANDGLGFMGPLALLVSADTSDRLTSLHGTIFNVLLALIWLHVVAVFFYLLVKRQDLVIPMFTGRKQPQFVPDGIQLRPARAWLAGLLFAAAGGAAWCLVRGQ